MFVQQFDRDEGVEIVHLNDLLQSRYHLPLAASLMPSLTTSMKLSFLLQVRQELQGADQFFAHSAQNDPRQAHTRTVGGPRP